MKSWQTETDRLQKEEQLCHYILFGQLTQCRRLGQGLLVYATVRYMKKTYLLIGLIVVVFIAVLLWLERSPEILPTVTVPGVAKPGDFAITSSAFVNEGAIPIAFTCDGENVHPPLTVVNPPPGAKSLVLIVTDPDAPMGTFTHWTMWNIDPGVSEIPMGNVPQKTFEGLTSAEKPGYVAPCPPSGTHRYFFELSALDSILGLNGQATKQDLETAMSGHVIAKTTLIGRYSRK